MQSAQAIRATIKEIRETYSQDQRPWVIGFSGGKDSTCALQLVWQALLGIPKGNLRKPIYVISSDTLVESPAIVNYIKATMASIGSSAQDDGLPISADVVQPKVEDSFWVNMIGRGYPAPNTKFRWCTDRLKIQPANRFIRDQVARFGEVVLVLGVRSAESATRAQVMSMHSIDGSRLRTHRSLLGALVYAPIAEWTTDDVWSYLLQNAETPWHSDNNDLAAMYRSADGECPLVVDTTTPSCGNSRFGCWVCTVVTRDKSMEAMIDSGQWWMEDLLKLRDFLAQTHEPERRREVRSIRKLSGQILLKSHANEASPGPYTFEFCKDLLERVLRIQATLPPEAGDLVLITEPELLAIRQLWREERNDWEDSVPRIFEKSTGKRWFSISDATTVVEQEVALIEETAREHEIPPLLLRKLIDAERRAQGLKRRSEVFKELQDVLNQDWRDETTVAADIASMEV